MKCCAESKIRKENLTKIVESLRKIKNCDGMKNEVDDFLHDINRNLNGEKNLLRHR